jgi:hypothetical protein
MFSEQERNKEAIEVYKEALKRRPSYYAPQSIYNMLGNPQSLCSSIYL